MVINMSSCMYMYILASIALFGTQSLHTPPSSRREKVGAVGAVAEMSILTY
ncbi:hypothetical protein IF2G_10176 [Cordyceps javanica]|nr:hypothetical protein IF2G_10176 [Cordyceps javanica]